MSFNVYARRVRDSGLPLHRRVSALASCVQLHRPFGFHGTLAFLELEAGPFHNDEQALLRALDVLEDLRARWQAEAAAYAETRRAEKRTGRRVPDPRAPNPHTRLWQGNNRDQAAGAEYQLWLWAVRRAEHPTGPATDPLENEVWRLVRTFLNDRTERRVLLDTCIEAVEVRMARSTSGDEHRRWRNLLAVTHLIRTASADR